MELLTDPGLYKAKKKHHKSKKVAEQFQMEKMQREFEEESAMRAADLREELRRENQEREDEIGAMMETIPQELPTVAEGSLSRRAAACGRAQLRALKERVRWPKFTSPKFTN